MGSASKRSKESGHTIPFCRFKQLMKSAIRRMRGMKTKRSKSKRSRRSRRSRRNGNT